MWVYYCSSPETNHSCRFKVNKSCNKCLIREQDVRSDDGGHFWECFEAIPIHKSIDIEQCEYCSRRFICLTTE
jgi:hypothetical protein